MSLDEKVMVAQHRIEELWHETNGSCCLSFSGGKDSTVLLALTKMCQELCTIGEIPAVYADTGIEMQVTIDFVKWVKENYYPNVQIIRPVKPFAWVIKTHGKPMLSKLKSTDLHQFHYGKKSNALMCGMLLGETLGGKSNRRHKIADKYIHMMHDDFNIKPSSKCCKYMKKIPFAEYSKQMGMNGVMQGVRADEGGAREQAALLRLKNGGKLCTWLKDGTIQKAPIIDWTDADVDEFIEKYNVPLSKAYIEYGFHRTGCMACPFAPPHDLAHSLEYLHTNEPNRYKAAMFFLKDVYIAQNVKLPFDPGYERERERKWAEEYEPMRQEMLRKYRPNSRLIKQSSEMKLFY